MSGMSSEEDVRRSTAVSVADAATSTVADDGIALAAGATTDTTDEAPASEPVTAASVVGLSYEAITARIKELQDDPIKAEASKEELLQLELWQGEMKVLQLSRYSMRLNNQITTLNSIASKTPQQETNLNALKARLVAVEKDKDAAEQSRTEKRTELNTAVGGDTSKIWAFDESKINFGFDVTATVDGGSVVKLTDSQISERIDHLAAIKDEESLPEDKVEKLQLELWQAEIAKKNLAATASAADKKAADDKVEAAKKALKDADDSATPWDFSKYVPPAKSSAGPGGSAAAVRPEPYEDKSENPFVLESKSIFGRMFEALMKNFTLPPMQILFHYLLVKPTAVALSELAGYGYGAAGGVFKILGLTGNRTLNIWGNDALSQSVKYSGTFPTIGRLFVAAFGAVELAAGKVSSNEDWMQAGRANLNGYKLWEDFKNSIVGKAVAWVTLQSLPVGAKQMQDNIYERLASFDSPKDPNKSMFAVNHNLARYLEETRLRNAGANNAPTIPKGVTYSIQRSNFIKNATNALSALAAKLDSVTDAPAISKIKGLSSAIGDMKYNPPVKKLAELMKAIKEIPSAQTLDERLKSIVALEASFKAMDTLEADKDADPATRKDFTIKIVPADAAAPKSEPEPTLTAPLGTPPDSPTSATVAATATPTEAADRSTVDPDAAMQFINVTPNDSNNSAGNSIGGSLAAAWKSVTSYFGSSSEEQLEQRDLHGAHRPNGLLSFFKNIFKPSFSASTAKAKAKVDADEPAPELGSTANTSSPAKSNAVAPRDQLPTDENPDPSSSAGPSMRQ